MVRLSADLFSVLFMPQGVVQRVKKDKNVVVVVVVVVGLIISILLYYHNYVSLLSSSISLVAFSLYTSILEEGLSNQSMPSLF